MTPLRDATEVAVLSLVERWQPARISDLAARLARMSGSLTTEGARSRVRAVLPRMVAKRLVRRDGRHIRIDTCG